MAMSRLLLNVKSSQAFQDKLLQRSTSLDPSKSIRVDTSLRSPTPQSVMEYEMNNVSPGEVTNTYLYPESSRGMALRLDTMFAHENPEDTQKGDDWSIQPNQSSSITQSLWWWMRPKRVGDMHVHIDIADGNDPLEPKEAGGLKESRLGRYDHWL
jgi:hypothetical protein